MEADRRKLTKPSTLILKTLHTKNKMVACSSQLSFIIFLFCGGFLTFSPCHADHPGHCTLADVKNCTGDLLSHLEPIACYQAELACLENLENCDDVSTMISVFRYLCNNETGGLDVEAVNTCLADDIRSQNLTKAAEGCMARSMWTDSLEGEARCNVATTFTACAKTAAQNVCSGDRAATFYDKTAQLLTSYGCFGGEAATIMPNLGTMAMILGLSLMMLQFT